jgi:signal transduction histidine kinase
MPGYIEASLYGLSLWLNYKKRYFPAAIIMLVSQNTAAAYFGLFFGANVPIKSLCLALLMTSMFIFQKRKYWIWGVLMSAAAVAVVNLNSIYHFVEPWQFDLGGERAIIWLADATIFMLSCIVTGYFVFQMRRANENKTIYLRETNHEINRHLAAQSLILDRYSRLPEDDQASVSLRTEELRKIKLAAKSISSVVADGLEIARIESGARDKTEYEAIDLRGLLFDIKEETEVFLQMKNLDLHINIKDSVPEYIVADRIKLAMILSNLIANAIKFSFKDSSIIVNAWKADEQLICQVIDFGKGMNARKRSELFHSLFVTEDNQLIRGNGVGMSMTRRTVELLGGKISVKSEEGKGAAFLVSLPCQQELPADQAPIRWDKKLLREKTILVVDDDAGSRMQMTQLLNNIGAKQVYQADSDVMALRLFAQVKADLIVIDAHLGKIDGIEFAAGLASVPTHNIKAIIVMSSEDSDVIRSKVRQIGAHYIKKPLSAIDFGPFQSAFRKLLSPPVSL